MVSKEDRIIISIKDTDHFKMVQRLLFKCGCIWGISRTTTHTFNCRTLIVNKGIMTHTDHSVEGIIKSFKEEEGSIFNFHPTLIWRNTNG